MLKLFVIESCAGSHDGAALLLFRAYKINLTDPNFMVAKGILTPKSANAIELNDMALLQNAWPGVPLHHSLICNFIKPSSYPQMNHRLMK